MKNNKRAAARLVYDTSTTRPPLCKYRTRAPSAGCACVCRPGVYPGDIYARGR